MDFLERDYNSRSSSSTAPSTKRVETSKDGNPNQNNIDPFDYNSDHEIYQ